MSTNGVDILGDSINQGDTGDIRDVFRRSLDDLRHASATPIAHVDMEEKLSRAGMIVAHPDDVPALRKLVAENPLLFPAMKGPGDVKGQELLEPGRFYALDADAMEPKWPTPEFVREDDNTFPHPFPWRSRTTT